jgi:hypothetical protein
MARPKSELASMNTCGSVAIPLDVYFVTASQKNNGEYLEQRYAIEFCVELRKGDIDPY